MPNNYYRIISKELKCVILLKVIPLKKQGDLLTVLQNTIYNSDNSVGIREYKKGICKDIVHNYDEIISVAAAILKVEKISEEQEYKISDFLYKALVQIYPNFSIEAICDTLNFRTFTETNKDDLVEVKNGMESFLMLKDDAPPNKIPAIGKQQLISSGMSLKFINSLSKFLKSKLIGQNESIDKIIQGIKLKEVGFSDHISYFLIGKSGIGKSFMSELLAQKYANNRFFRVDCTSMNDGHEKSALIGSPPGYVGHTDKSILATKAEQSNNWVFLFDEIEKAHDKFFDWLMPLLEKGVVKDNNGVELDFTNSVFIFTSNEGVTYNDPKKTKKSIGFLNEGDELRTSNEKKELVEKLKSKFKIEFLNRLDDIIVLNDLSKDDIRKIISIELRKYPTVVTKGLIEHVLDNSYSFEFGARNIKRYIKTSIGVPIADAILSGVKTNTKRHLYSCKVIGNQVIIQQTDPAVTEPIHEQGSANVSTCSTTI